MNVIAQWLAGSLLLLLLLSGRCLAQQPSLERYPRNWDVGFWVAGATGEENTNSFAEAQTFSAALFVGKTISAEMGSGWRRGRLEYAFDVIPVFVQWRPARLYGGGFEPIILRWNSSLHRGPVSPYIELAGGALRTNSNLPSGNTSDFNFTARGGGGIEIFAAHGRSFDLGYRWAHISNANLGPRNPEFNGIQVSVGYHWSP